LRTASVSSSTPLIIEEPGAAAVNAPPDWNEADARASAAAFAAHERLRKAGGAQNKFGASVFVRFVKLLMGHYQMLDGTILFMPDRDPYERFAGSWAAMSVYGSLVGVAALQYGMPDVNAEDRNLLYHISSSLLLSASMLLIVPVCQLTVLTIMFALVPSRQIRERIFSNRILVSVTGPIHLIATQLVFIGIVFRLLSTLDFDHRILLMYLVPFVLSFALMWGFTLFTVAVTLDYSVHEDAWKVALGKVEGGVGEDSNASTHRVPEPSVSQHSL